MVIMLVTLVSLCLIGLKVYLSLWIDKFPCGVPAEAVVVLGHGKPWSWLVADYDKGDLEAIVKFLERRGKEFSFYVHPGEDDVRRIMADKSVKEVFFVGHGGTHFFRLKVGQILSYCLFDDIAVYGKDFVHQVHCGTLSGMSLIERVVPEKNRKKCFYFDREIKSRDVESGFERLACRDFVYYRGYEKDRTLSVGLRE